MLILDMGPLTGTTFPQFLQCDLRIVVCPLAPWKQRYLEEWLSLYQAHINIHPETTIFLGNLGERNKTPVEKPLLHPFYFVPFIQNPFLLTASEWPFFENMLKRT